MHGLIGTVSNKHWSGETRLLSFEFRLGVKPAEERRGEVFVPLPAQDVAAIRTFLTERGRSETDEVGHVRLTIGPTHIHWEKFYPLGAGRALLNLRRRGIGSRVHHVVVEHLADNYREREIYHSTVSEDRKTQLKAMDIYPTFDVLPIEIYRRKVREYMVKKFGMQFA